LGDEVSLEFYRLQKIGDTNIALESTGEYGLDNEIKGGIRGGMDEKSALSEIIEMLNKRFSTEFGNADKLFFDSIEEQLYADDKLRQQAQANTMENFKFGFEDVFMDAVIGRMEQNQDIFTKMMDDSEFGGLVKRYMMRKVYEGFTSGVDIHKGR
jgi:type I restriction enzyme R subunit